MEELDGRPYQDAIQARVLDPLGMRDSHSVIGYETRKRAAVGYRRFYDDRPEHRDHELVPALWTEYGVGDGCQASTIGDMCIYLRMLMNGGEGPATRVMSAEGYRLMTQRVVATQQWGGAWYGYGLIMADLDGHAYLGHGGSTTGFMSAMVADMDDGIGVVVLINVYSQFYDAAGLALDSLAVLRAGLRGQELPAPPPGADPGSVINTADYAGSYRSGEDRMDVSARGNQLTLHWRGREAALERRSEDSFYVSHPDMELFLLEFGRDGVVEVFHGPDWYIREGYSGPRSFHYPEAWETYLGHYRTYNFGLTNFRIVLRKGALLLIYPSGGHEVLTPLDDGLFSNRRRPALTRKAPVRFHCIGKGAAGGLFRVPLLPHLYPLNPRYRAGPGPVSA